MLAAKVQLKQIMQQYAAEVDSALRQYLEDKDSLSRPVFEAMRYSIFAGGKRFRPILCLLASEVCGGNRDEAIPAACAIEMVHTYSLIHDDLPAMDDDDFRRGKPSCHKAFGEALAILAGDALLTQGFAVLAREVKDPAKALRLISELAAAAGASGMVAGQALDTSVMRHESSVMRDKTTLKEIHLRKTARLIEAAAGMGAIVASADKRQLAALREYGQHLGLAFQIADDLMDARTPEGKDAEGNKLTYPSLYGADEAKRQAQKEREAAIDALREFGAEADTLRDLAKFAVERNI